MRQVKRRTAILVTAGLVMATLALPGGAARASAPSQAGAKCPLSALKKADKPVEITFWHATNGANTDALIALTDKFNSSQSDVKVTLVNNTDYDDNFEKFTAGLRTGDLPDIVMVSDYHLQQMIDTESVLPAQACVKADKYDLSDHIERVIEYYKVKGTLWPMPFNVSNPVFFYNKNAFEAAGLDPEDPPSTLDEIKAAAQKLHDSGASSQSGFALKLDPWFLEQWEGLAGKPYANNGNGRKGRATEVVFNNKVGLDVFKWVDEMQKAGLLQASDQNAFDNLLAVGNDQAGMTIDTSASLGTIIQTLEDGLYPNVEPGVAPLPTAVKGKGGVLVGGGALYMSSRSPKAKQAAAWEYLKFLNEPETQAEWAAASGYVPIRKSAAELPAITEVWDKYPFFKVAYDQLLTGAENSSSAGPVIGDYKGVRDVIIDALQSMLSEGKSPKAALKAAKKAADAKIQEYNSRVGA